MLSPALRRGSRRNRGGSSTAAAMFGVTTRSRGREQQRSSRSNSAGNELDGTAERLPPAEGCRKRKRAKLDGISRRVSSARSASKGKSGQDRLERKAKKRNLGEEEEDGGSCSSAGSSPLREPYMPVEVESYSDGAERASSKYRDMQEDYHEKIARQMEMPTLIPDTPPNCLVNDPMLLHIREASRKKVLHAAQFVVGISSSIGGKPLARCSGFLMDLNKERKTGTVVTTAHLIRTKRPSLDAWLCKDEYASDAKVTVHLRGGNNAKGCLLYHQKHYNLAFFNVKMDPSIQLPFYSDEVECAQDIFELGRDESANLVINHGRVEYSNPTVYERFDHMYIQGPHRNRKVSACSPAEKCGIRVGDVIECFNEKCISTALELENMLLSIVVNSEDGLPSDLDVEIQVYCTRRNLRRIKALTVKVSEDGEFVVRGQRSVTA